MNKIKVLAILILGLSLTTPYIYGYFAANESCSAFVPAQCSSGINKNLSTETGLGQLIIDGAGYFLQSSSDFQFFLKKVELSAAYGINYEELGVSLDNAIKNLTMAKSIYFEICRLAVPLEYDSIVLKKLDDFDYNGYQNRNDLNTVIFGDVASLLKRGDVKGFYRVFYQGLEKILARLKDIKTTVAANQLPIIAACWRINQSYLELELYGQYVAEVFMNLN